MNSIMMSARVDAINVDTIDPVVQAEEPQHFENDQFVGDIKQEGGKWVAKLEYKNGTRAERFAAKSKNDLLMELLRGKGHATIRVREAARRENMGQQLDRSYKLPDGMSAETFNALPERTQCQLIDKIAAANVAIFRDQAPDYHVSPGNLKALDSFLIEHNLPHTVTNLKYAHEELKADDLYPDARETLA